MNTRIDNSAKNISAFNSIIVFISFMIIYYFITFKSGAFTVFLEKSDEWPSATRAILIFAAASPLFVGISVVGYFFWSISLELYDYAKAEDFKLFDTIAAISMFFGSVIFIALISAFVAFQSSTHIKEISPQIKNQTEQILSFWK